MDIARYSCIVHMGNIEMHILVLDINWCSSVVPVDNMETFALFITVYMSGWEEFGLARHYLDIHV